MKKIIWCLFMAPFFCLSQTHSLSLLSENTKTSLRGLSVVDKKTIWVSGSNGYVGKTIDGGITWKWVKPKGYEQLDFRAIKAFNAKEAVIVNAGSPAYILKTIDGGENWVETYKNIDSAIFLDGLGFWNKTKGIIFGDPIANKMQLLKTDNAGKSWVDGSKNLSFELAKGEAGFAASGTSIKTQAGGKVWIATGGTAANIYHSDDYGQKWKVFKCPIWQGESSTGTFSMDFYDKLNGIVVGGNYVKDKQNDNNILLTSDGGKTWQKPESPVFGYRSGVTYINKILIIATGTSGTDLSTDGGKNWQHLSDISFNAVQKAKNGRSVFLAGNKGLIYRLNIVVKS